jgi:glycogen debranching enzyme
VAAQFLNDAPSEDRARWAALAERLQRTTLDRFWMPEERYFAMAIDRDPRSGEARQVRVLSSNPGSLLDSGIFDTLDPQERRRCVTAIVEHVHSSQFLTPVGVRCNSVIHRDLQDYAGYQSSYTVWHKETYDIAKGFRRQGFPRLAQDLENRLLNAVNIAGGATEFLYVMPDNRVDYAPLDLTNRPEAEVISGTNVPENDQAWSIAAALAIKWRRGHEQDGQSAPEGWQRDLEARLLDRVPFTPVLRTIREVQQALPSGYSFRVDRGKGWESETAFTRRRDLPARQ